MKRTGLIIAVVLLIAFLAISAFGKPCGDKYDRCFDGRKGPGIGMHRGGPGQGAGPGVGMILKLKEKLNLTDEQVKQLEAIKTEFPGKSKAGGKAVKAKREALHKLVEAGADEAAIRATADEIGKAIGDQAVLKAGIKAKVDGVLTDAQKTQLKELKKQCKEKFEKCKQNWGKDQKSCKGYEKSRDPKAAFAKIDTNNDGTINLEEFTTHMKLMKKYHGSKGLKSRWGPRSQGPAEEPQD